MYLHSRLHSIIYSINISFPLTPIKYRCTLKKCVSHFQIPYKPSFIIIDLITYHIYTITPNNRLRTQERIYGLIHQIMLVTQQRIKLTFFLLSFEVPITSLAYYISILASLT